MRNKLYIFLFITLSIIILMAGRFQRIVGEYQETSFPDEWVSVNTSNIVSQAINISCGTANTSGIAFSVDGSQLTQNCELTVNIQQGEKYVKNFYVVSRGMEPQKIKLDIAESDFQNGPAELTIISQFAQKDDNLLLGITSYPLFAETLSINGEQQGKCIAFEIYYSINELSKKEQAIRILVISILLLSFFLNLYFVIKPDGKLTYKVFWLLTVAFTFCYISLTYFGLLFNTQPFIEAALLFRQSAQDYGLLKSFKILDTGYLCILGHLFSWIAIEIKNTLGIGSCLVMNILSVLFISVMNSLICLPGFAITDSWKTRFIVSISLPLLWVRQFESFSYVNFAYWGAILLILLLFIDYEKLSVKNAICLGFVCACIVLSKGILVLFLPIYMGYGLVLFANKKLNTKHIIICTSVIFSSIIQFLSYFLFGGSEATDKAGILDLIKGVFAQTGRIVIGFIYKNSEILPFKYTYLVGAVFILSVFFLLLFLTVKKRISIMDFIVLALIFVLFLENNIMMNISVYYIPNTTNIYYSRQEFISILSVVIFVTFLLGKLQKKRCNVIVLLFMSFFSLQTLVETYTDWVFSPNTGEFSTNIVYMTDIDRYEEAVSEPKFFTILYPWYFTEIRGLNGDFFTSYNLSFLGRNDESYEKSCFSQNILENCSHVNSVFVDNSRTVVGIYYKKTSISNGYVFNAYNSEGRLVERAYSGNTPYIYEYIRFNEDLTNVSYITVEDQYSGIPLSIASHYIIVYL